MITREEIQERCAFGEILAFKDCILKDLDLSEIDASHSNFSGALLEKVDFSHANLEGSSFTLGRITQCKFDDADLTNTNFKDKM